jgi:hypothetical protein
VTYPPNVPSISRCNPKNPKRFRPFKRGAKWSKRRYASIAAMSAVTHVCQTDGQTLLTGAASVGGGRWLDCCSGKQASAEKRTGITGRRLCVRNSYGKPNIVGGGRWVGATRIMAIYFSSASTTFNAISTALGTGVSPDSYPVLAQPLGHLRLSRAETFPRTSPLPSLAGRPACHTRCNLSRGGRWQSRIPGLMFLLLQVQRRHM